MAPFGIEFDPKPLIKNLDLFSDELLRVKKKVQNKIEDLEDQASASESTRKRKMKDLTDTFEVTYGT